MFLDSWQVYLADVEMAQGDGGLRVRSAMSGCVLDCRAYCWLQRRKSEEASYNKSERGCITVMDTKTHLPDAGAVSMRDGFNETDCLA